MRPWRRTNSVPTMRTARVGRGSLARRGGSWALKKPVSSTGSATVVKVVRPTPPWSTTFSTHEDWIAAWAVIPGEEDGDKSMVGRRVLGTVLVITTRRGAACVTIRSGPGTRSRQGRGQATCDDDKSPCPRGSSVIATATVVPNGLIPRGWQRASGRGVGTGGEVVREKGMLRWRRGGGCGGIVGAGWPNMKAVSSSVSWFSGMSRPVTVPTLSKRPGMAGPTSAVVRPCLAGVELVVAVGIAAGEGDHRDPRRR